MKKKDKKMLKRVLLSSLFSYLMYKIMNSDEKKKVQGIPSFNTDLVGAYKPLSIFLDRFNKAQINKIESVARNIGVEPNWLVALMGFENGYRFSPSYVNPWGYTGLIQIGDAAAHDLGTTTDKLRRMSFIEQMDYVERYFTVVNKRLLKYVHSIEDLYCIIIYPMALTKPADWICGSQKSLATAEIVADRNFLFKDSRGYMTRNSIRAGLRAFYKKNFPKYYPLLFD